MPEGEKSRKQESEWGKKDTKCKFGRSWFVTVQKKNILESKVAEHTQGSESFV